MTYYRTIYRNDEPPDDPAILCEVCGYHVDVCICPECDTCGEQGCPACYEPGSVCGLVANDEQRSGRANLDAMLAFDAQADRIWADMSLIEDVLERYFRWPLTETERDCLVEVALAAQEHFNG